MPSLPSVGVFGRNTAPVLEIKYVHTNQKIGGPSEEQSDAKAD